MNAPLSLQPPRPFSAADLFHLVDLGLIDREARVELIDGALVPMSPKGRQHEIMRERLAIWLKAPGMQTFNVLQEHTLTLGEGLVLEPDFILYDAGRRIADAPLKGSDLRLVIEVADSSLAFDLGAKAALYAAHGVSEYWVIDAMRKEAHIHRNASAGGWTSIRKLASGEAIEPLCAPGTLFRL